MLALGERTRAQVEDLGRVQLTDVEARFLSQTKDLHIALFVVVVLGKITLSLDGSSFYYIFGTFLLGGIVESFFAPSTTNVEVCKRVIKVFFAWMVGCFGFEALVVMSE